MRVLVTGGSGMVGRALQEYLPDALYPTSSELDLMDSASVSGYFAQNNIDYVVHLAAHVGSLHDNIENSVAYFNNNVLMNTLITKAAYENDIKKFLGILSTCIYPDNCASFPIDESQLHEGAPHIDLMTYSYAKRSHAVQLDAYKKSYGVQYNYLIPCNVYGVKNPNNKGRSHYLNDLVFKIIKSQKEGADHIELFGDGSPLRQFMLADDFARLIAEYIKQDLDASMNVASSWNLSIDEMARIALRVCGSSDFAIKYNSTKPNGQHRKDVSTVKLRSAFPDFEFTELETGLRRIYEYYLAESGNE